MASKIWSERSQSYVGEVRENGRVWSERRQRFVGEVGDSGRVWSDDHQGYVGGVQENGRVWSDVLSRFVGEVRVDGRIWSDIRNGFAGEIHPPDMRHGAAALLLVLEPVRREPGPDPSGEWNWPLFVLLLTILIPIGFVYVLWKYRHPRGLFFLYVVGVMLSGVFLSLISAGQPLVVAALVAAAAGLPLYRLCFSIWRWRAKPGPRISAWIASGVMAAATLATAVAAGLLQPELLGAAVATYQRGADATSSAIEARAPPSPSAPTITITDKLAAYQSRETVEIFLDGTSRGTLSLDRAQGVDTASLAIETSGGPLRYVLKGVETDTRDGLERMRTVRGEGSLDAKPGGNYEFQPVSFSDNDVVEYIKGVEGAPYALRDSGPEPSPSFNCADARSDAERFICGDAVVAAAERRMAEAYWAARARTADKGAIIESQRQFLQTVLVTPRDRTSFVTMYDARTKELSRY